MFGPKQERTLASPSGAIEAVTDTALGYLTLDALLDELLARVLRIVEADTAAILLRDGDELVARATKGLEEEAQRGVRIPIGRGFSGRVAAERQPVAIEDVGHADLQNPFLLERGIRSLLGVPILFEGRVIGVLHVGTLGRRRFGRSDAQLLQVVADRIGLGIEYARLYGEAQEAARRAAFAAEASRVLAGSLDVRTTLERLAHLAVPFLGDWCVVVLTQASGAVRQLAAAHVVPEKLDLALRLAEDHSMQRRALGPLWAVLQCRETQVFQAIDEAFLANLVDSSAELETLRGLGVRSGMIVPLVAHDQALGVMVFAVTESEYRYGSADVAAAEDLARRAALAVDNARLFREAQESTRLRDEFLATVSHELRTPLTPILTWTQLLRPGRQDPAMFARAIDAIERSARAQAQLIEDLLDVSRIITGRLRIDVRPMPLWGVVEAAIESMGPAAEAKGILLDVVLDPQARLVMGDADRLQQVVWNLLSNAIKFTPPGGRVAVRVEQVDDEVRLTVRDTGKGIRPEFAPYVFERFRQADSSTTRAHGGLGLGLAIVRHLVELHGGSVSAESAGEGRGATFIVRLPATVVEDARGPAWAPAPQALEARPLAGRRVLVVDDDRDTCEALDAILAHAGAEVRTSCTVAGALGELGAWPADVLVSDIAMPGEDGFALVRAVRARPPEAGGRVPVLALTAYAHKHERVRILEAGFALHLAKPVDSAELVAASSRTSSSATVTPARRRSGPA